MSDYSIMIVDDEEGILENLKKSLVLAGYKKVETYSSPIKAMEIFKEKKYHIVLADIVMPEMDGIEFLKEVRGYDPMTQVIMMSGFSTIDKILSCLEYGANDCILKPFKNDNCVLEVVEYSVKKLDRWKEAIKGVVKIAL
ncbi:MAG: response regulator [Firmicutes bacterium]|nr:response regulator [Bacillota bacterium]